MMMMLSIASESRAQRRDDTEETKVVARQEQFSF